MPAHDKLKDYQEKRDFSRTPEPAGTGRKPSADRPLFVVQKHAARTLHYEIPSA